VGVAPARGRPQANGLDGIHVAETEEANQRLERAFGQYVPDEDRDAVIRTVFGEAGNQAPEGQAAVAHTIRNRARQSGETPYDIVHARAQYEPWSNPVARTRTEGLDRNSPEYHSIGEIVDPIMRGEMPDVTGGATHFYAPKAQKAMGRPAPRWANGKGIDIGDHRFYRIGYPPRRRRNPGNR
jgi:spore germination cell wall hydrolase CwlJ-like protein